MSIMARSLKQNLRHGSVSSHSLPSVGSIGPHPPRHARPHHAGKGSMPARPLAVKAYMLAHSLDRPHRKHDPSAKCPGPELCLRFGRFFGARNATKRVFERSRSRKRPSHEHAKSTARSGWVFCRGIRHAAAGPAKSLPTTHNPTPDVHEHPHGRRHKTRVGIRAEDVTTNTRT
jgi:hypothetical protein